MYVCVCVCVYNYICAIAEFTRDEYFNTTGTAFELEFNINPCLNSTC